MNKSMLFLGGGAVVILILVGALLLVPGRNDARSADQSSPEAMSDNASDQMGQQPAESGPLTFTDLARLGKNYECTFRTEDEGTTTRGTVYVASATEQLRADVTVVLPEQEARQMHIIREGSTSYFWTENEDQGMKFDDPDGDMSMESSGSEAEVETEFDPNATYDFDCNQWSVDATRFSLPSEVRFVDFSSQLQMMQGADSVDGSMADSPNQDACAVCEQVPAGEARTHCLQSLGC